MNAASPRTVPIGVVGVGHLGRHHARILSETPACHLVGIHDVDSDRASTLARKLGTEAFASLDDLLARAEAITVATPTVHHHEVARRALDRGIHTLVEKPITTSLEEAGALLELSRKNHVLLQVGHVERFNGAILAVKDLVSQPRFVEVHRLSPFPDRSTDVGVILDLMIHDLDILLSLVRSPVVQIDPIGTSVITDKEDIANARIRFASGCVANITASRISAQTMRKIRIFSSDSYISVDYHKQDAVMYRKKSGTGRVSSMNDIERVAPRIEKTEPLRLELEAFASACRGENPRAASGEEGKNALEVALEIGRLIAEEAT